MIGGLGREGDFRGGGVVDSKENVTFRRGNYFEEMDGVEGGCKGKEKYVVWQKGNLVVGEKRLSPLKGGEGDRKGKRKK